METTTKKKHTKLTSRKFWVAVATAAYFGGMAVKEQSEGSQLGAILFGVCMGAVIVAWIAIEGFCDKEDEEVEEGTLIEDEIKEAE